MADDEGLARIHPLGEEPMAESTPTANAAAGCVGLIMLILVACFVVTVVAGTIALVRWLL